MNRKELNAIIKAGPVKIYVNDGRQYVVTAPDEALISDFAAHVLYRSQTGKLKAMILPLDSVSGVEPIRS